MAFKVGSIYGEAILDTKKWTAGTSKMKASMAVTGKAIAAFSVAAAAAIGAFMIKSVKEADKFNKSLSNVNTLLSDGQANIGDLRTQLLSLDSTLGSTTELTDGLYQAISAGADPAGEAMQVVIDSAKFAKAALTDTKTAVDVLTTATNAYGDQLDNTQQAADIFFTTIKQGKINGQQLASVIGQSIPLFASLGIPLEELGSGLAAMTKQGVNAAEATTQLNAIINSFLTPSAEMSAALKNIGVESGATLLETKGLAGALKLLEDATGGNKDELKKLIPNIRGFKGAMALTGEGGREFTEIMEEMANATGATGEAFAKQEITFETLKNTMNKVFIIVGQKLIPIVYEAANAVSVFISSAEGQEFIEDMGNALLKVTKILGGFIKMLAETIVWITRAPAPIKIAIAVIGGFVTAINIAKIAMIAFNATNPVGWIALAAGAMVILIGKIVKYQETTGKAVKASNDFRRILNDLPEGAAGIKIIRDEVSKLNEAELTELRSVQQARIDSYKEKLDLERKNQEAIKANSKEAAADAKRLALVRRRLAIDETGGTTRVRAAALQKEIELEEKRLSEKGKYTSEWMKILHESQRKIADEEQQLLTKSTVQGQEAANDRIKTREMELRNAKKVMVEIDSASTAFVDSNENVMGSITDAIKNASLQYDNSFNDMVDGAADASQQMGDGFLESFVKFSKKFKIKTAFMLADFVTNVKTAAEKAGKFFEEKVAPVIQKIGAVVEMAGDAFNAVFDTVTLKMENDLTSLEEAGKQETLMLETEKENQLSVVENSFARQEEILEEKRSTDLITQEEFDLAQAELHQKKADQTANIEKTMDDKISKQKEDQRTKENAQKKKMFEAQKANTIANIWVQYAIGLVGLWMQSIAQLGPIAGSIMAGIMTGVLTGVAIANTVLVSQQSFIPERRFGGMASGMTKINEDGGEIVSLPDGSQVIPNDISRQIAADSGSGDNVNNYVFNFDGATISGREDMQKISDFIIRKISRELRLQT